jgi:acyl-CoA synthetase (AMP-forming)/AMP-acid ligase II
MDWRGYIYFVDRLGDTFRWKGENVSTIEVENIISERLNSIEVIVYGVQIPGHEGRAGMATITKLEVDLNELGDHLKQDLPAYAKPLFVRLKENVDHTGSFKAQKSVLIEEAFNVNIFSDPTYYFDQKAQRYLPLDKSALGKINNGLITF